MRLASLLIQFDHAAISLWVQWRASKLWICRFQKGRGGTFFYVSSLPKALIVQSGSLVDSLELDNTQFHPLNVLGPSLGACAVLVLAAIASTFTHAFAGESRESPSLGHLRRYFNLIGSSMTLSLVAGSCVVMGTLGALQSLQDRRVTQTARRKRLQDSTWIVNALYLLPVLFVALATAYGVIIDRSLSKAADKLAQLQSEARVAPFSLSTDEHLVLASSAQQDFDRAFSWVRNYCFLWPCYALVMALGYAPVVGYLLRRLFLQLKEAKTRPNAKADQQRSMIRYLQLCIALLAGVYGICFFGCVIMMVVSISQATHLTRILNSADVQTKAGEVCITIVRQTFCWILGAGGASVTTFISLRLHTGVRAQQDRIVQVVKYASRAPVMITSDSTLQGSPTTLPASPPAASPAQTPVGILAHLPAQKEVIATADIA